LHKYNTYVHTTSKLHGDGDNGNTKVIGTNTGMGMNSVVTPWEWWLDSMVMSWEWGWTINTHSSCSGDMLHAIANCSAGVGYGWGWM